MKEATGELNMTVVTVVAIAAIGTLLYAFVWPALENSIQRNTICAGGNGTMLEGSTEPARCTISSGQMTCSHPDINSGGQFQCDSITTGS